MRPFLVCAAALLCPAALAAPELKLTVGRDGALRVPVAVLRRLGVKAAENGMLCVQFPAPPAPPPRPPLAPGGGHDHSGPARPPRLWVAAARDGSLVLRRTRLVPGNEYVPGRPGTVYRAVVAGGCLVLSPVSGGAGRRPPRGRSAAR